MNQQAPQLLIFTRFPLPGRAKTRENMARLGLQGEELPILRDMDHPEDLTEIRHDPRFADLFTGRPLVSVIVPTERGGLYRGPAGALAHSRSGGMSCRRRREL